MPRARLFGVLMSGCSSVRTHRSSSEPSVVEKTSMTESAPISCDRARSSDAGRRWLIANSVAVLPSGWTLVSQSVAVVSNTR